MKSSISKNACGHSAGINFLQVNDFFLANPVCMQILKPRRIRKHETRTSLIVKVKSKEGERSPLTEDRRIITVTQGYCHWCYMFPISVFG